MQAVKNAAIAQPVERILGKDEVASSNLASSSKDTPKFLLRSFLYHITGDLGILDREGGWSVPIRPVVKNH